MSALLTLRADDLVTPVAPGWQLITATWSPSRCWSC